MCSSDLLVAEYQGDAAGKIHVVQRDGIRRQMGRKDGIDPASQFSETFPRIGILMDRKPLRCAAAAFGAPFFVPGYPRVEDKDVLYAHGIAGAHDGRDIMGVEDVFQYDGQMFLSFVQYAGDPLFSFRSHNSKKQK